MADAPKWHVNGEFYANCSCDNYKCPCPVSNFRATPTHGWCRGLHSAPVRDWQRFDLLTLAAA